MTWRPTTLTREQLEERRLEGARLLIEGKLSQAEIARHLGVTPSAVARWKQRLEAADDRIEALARRAAPGNAPSLSLEQWQQILRIIQQGAVNAGFQSERWTLARIRQMIGDRFGVQLSRVWIGRTLRELGFSPQQPVTRASNRDDELVEAWLRQDWPRIKKSLARGR
jgi:transposase